MANNLKNALDRIVLSTATVVTLANELKETARALARARVVERGDTETGAQAAVALADAEGASEQVREIATSTLKILASAATISPTEYLEPLGRTEHASPNLFEVSSARIERRGGFDIVHIWGRGAYAGELIVGSGDGPWIANRLGLFPKPDPLAAPEDDTE